MNGKSQSLSSKDRHEQQYPLVDVCSALEFFRSSRQTLLLLFSERRTSPDPQCLLPATLIHWLSDVANIRALEKRFIIRQDLLVRNQPLIAQLTAPQLLALAVRLSEQLTDEYLTRQDLNSLNSAIRLTDHLLQSETEQLLQIPQLPALLKNQLAILESLFHEPLN